MIKHFLLLILILALLLLAIEENQIVQVTIVLPPDLLPYYDWLQHFPGWQPPQEKPNIPHTLVTDP